MSPQGTERGTAVERSETEGVRPCTLLHQKKDTRALSGTDVLAFVLCICLRVQGQSMSQTMPRALRRWMRTSVSLGSCCWRASRIRRTQSPRQKPSSVL